MYKILTPPETVLRTYFNQYKDIVITKIREVLSPDFEIIRPLRQKTFKVRLSESSWIRTFLESLLDETNLYDFFSAEIDDVVKIIDKIERYDPHFRETLRKGKYPNVERGGIVEGFNAICKYIFVESVYDGKRANGVSIFKKIEFVKEKDLSICPYCGASDIHLVEKDGDSRTGYAYVPPIDHYFPKSKYPFLALNYYNLNPCCGRCNNINNKGTFDPYAKEVEKLRFLNPYLFRDDAFRFYFYYDGSGQYNKDNFTAEIDFLDNEHLVLGYTEGISLRKQYLHDAEIRNIWNQVEGHCSDGYKVLLTSALDVEKNNEHYVNFTSYDLAQLLQGFIPRSLWGYNWSEEESRLQLKYKFKRDILIQMVNLIRSS